ncbi:methionine--tRNA ligase [Sarracenia purpurea var. burkii]
MLLFYTHVIYWLVIAYLFGGAQKDEEVEIFRQKFAGSQADRVLKAEAEAKELVEKLKETEVSGFILSFLFALD